MTGVVTSDRKSNPYPAETLVKKQPSRRGVLTSAELLHTAQEEQMLDPGGKGRSFLPTLLNESYAPLCLSPTNGSGAHLALEGRWQVPENEAALWSWVTTACCVCDLHLRPHTISWFISGRPQASTAGQALNLSSMANESLQV